MLSGIPVLQEHLSGPHQSLAETASEAGRTSIMQPQAADVVIIGAGATRICRIGDHEQGRRGYSGPIPNRHRDRFFNGKLRILQALTCGNECQSSSATGRLPFPARLRKESRTKQYEQQIALRRHMGLMCGYSHRTTPKPSCRNCKSLLCRRPSLHLRMRPCRSAYGRAVLGKPKPANAV